MHQDVFGDDDADKRNFCDDIIGSNTLDVSAKNATLPRWSVAGIRDKCGADNTLMLACQEINPAAIVAHCRSTIDDVFGDDDDDKRNFCGDIIGSNTLDVSAENAKLPGWSVAGIRDKCDTGNTLMSVCRDIAPAAVVADE
ncbi:hypothetical protein BBO_09179 [Beauveria brongniartii RCEF 3172]|uniref:Uncharacterized protein n=1 Tax=Beauveria brongniartii RCEF 3172 TaxID=1081107 RepID=A0A166WAS2_9HYPO|nr:hypothetical protein BBO_09179 [Beauveria brongniartii RCEF 3172]